MSEKDKTLLIVILAAAVLCGCFVISCCAASFYFLSHADKNTVQELLNNGTIENHTEDPANRAPVENESDTFLSGNNSDDLSAAEQLIIEETEKVRGLSSSEKLAPTYQSEDELREYLINQLEEVSDEELADELLLYNVLGFAPKDFDLRQFYIDMYTEQIAGFYDPEENQMYLIKDGSPYENAVTLSHEYTHFLQYNHPEFSETLQYDDDFCEDHGETCLIINALIEGDATLTEGLIDAESIIGKYRDNSVTSTSSGSIYDSAPKFFQDSLLFPYVYGYDFVAYHYLKGGFDAVNDLYINLPQSVEQIMHPEKYLKDAPVDVQTEPFRSKIDNEFEIIREDVLNESDIKMLLADGYDENWQLSEQQSSAAAEGWGGGSFIIAKKDDKPLFFSKLVWDTEKDAEEAETVFTLYSDRRFGSSESTGFWKTEDSSSVYLVRQNDVLYWMILPDNFEAESFIGLIRNGSIL